MIKENGGDPNETKGCKLTHAQFAHIYAACLRKADGHA